MSSSHGAAVYFCLANPTGFSGQKAAVELLYHGLAQRGWRCRRIDQPVLEREAAGWRPLVRYGLGLVRAWCHALSLLKSPRASVVVGLGQTMVSFARDAPVLALARMVRPRVRVVISLHGSVFMQWRQRALCARIFRGLLRCAGVVTVLGHSQRQRLLDWGFPAERVRVVVNSCDLPPVDDAALEAKLSSSPARPLRLLYLSSLIDTKGYPDFLEALIDLGARPGSPIEAVLCGRLVASTFADRFGSLAEAEAWIEDRLRRINATGNVRAQWVRGAIGPAKARLFYDADVFVLPTRYAVEAQPLVLLEAMAAGCTIVTTSVGEIPTILDDSCAVLVNPSVAEELPQCLQKLRVAPAMRGALAVAGHQRFKERFQPSQHFTEWERLLAAKETP